MKHIAFFDLDGTILDGFSSENTFIFHLLKKGLIRFQQMWATLVFIFRWFPKYGKFVFIKDKAYLDDLRAKQIVEIGQKLVEERLIKRLRPRIVQYVNQHIKNGDMVVLLTGSLDFLAERFAKHLSIEHIEATICNVIEGKFACNPPLQHPFHKQKLDIAKRICKEKNIPLKNCFAYGNSINDYAILNAVGKAVAVTPDRKLKRIAQEKGWDIIN